MKSQYKQVKLIPVIVVIHAPNADHIRLILSALSLSKQVRSHIPPIAQPFRSSL